jgi:predicted nucleic acid-binding protein
MSVLNRREQDYVPASAAYTDLVTGGWRLYTTNWTLYDALSHMKERIKGGGLAAADALRALHLGNAFTVVPVTRALEERAVVLFWNHRDKVCSITTWANIVVMRNLDLRYVLSRSHHYDQAGFSRLY